MKRERPLALDAVQAAALLADPAMTVRRPIERLLRHGHTLMLRPNDELRTWWAFRDRAGRWSDILLADLLAACPLGQAGDGMWVREPWATSAACNLLRPRDFPRGSDKASRFARRVTYRTDHPKQDPWPDTLWRRPNQMPRWASRIDLVIDRVDIAALTFPDPDPLAPRFEWSLQLRRVRPRIEPLTQEASS